MALDKISMDLMKSLHKEDLPEQRILEMISPKDFHARLPALMSQGMISRKRISGVPDGESGYVDGTVKYLYHLEPNGRSEVERERKNHLLWMIGTGIALLAATGAILSALPN